MPPAIYSDGHIYSNTEIGDSLQCLSADGEVKWKTGGKLSLSLGSLLIADDLIFVQGGSSGVLHLVEASPKGFNELAQAKLDLEDANSQLHYQNKKLLIFSRICVI